MPVRGDEPHRLPWGPDHGKEFLCPAWGEVFGRLGIPRVPGRRAAGACVRRPAAVDGFIDRQWEGFFAENVLLDARQRSG